MKKVYSLLLVLCLIFSLSACGGNESTTDDDTGSFCTECGEEISATDNFCSSCGASIDKSNNTSTTDNNATQDNTDYSDNADVPSSTASKPNTAEPDISKPTTTEPESTKPSTPTHAHSYSGATCTAPAKCSCGETDGSALGHNYNSATCTEAKKCSRCGATDGDALGHSYSNATCTEAKKCTRCGITEGSALGHSFSNATCTEAKKCTRCGITEGSALGHKWQEATCSAPKTCSDCGITEGEATQHSFDNNGNCIWCKQILPVSPDKVKNREYECWNGFDVSYFDFATSIASMERYLPCSIVYSETWCGDEESHIIVNGFGSHCVAGTVVPLSFIYKKTDKYIIISNLAYYEDMVLTVEVLSNDTMRVVNLTGTAPQELNVGDIFK